MTQHTIIEVDRNCQPTKKGARQVAIKTEKGVWIKLHGGDLDKLRPDLRIQTSEPAQFGKSWYAELKQVEEPAQTTQQAQTYANGATQPWSEWEAMAARAHALAKVLEPDTICPAMAIPQGETATWKEAAHHVDRSRARAMIWQTLMVAYRDHKIGTEESDIPF
jgi:hypothetical protein